MFFNPYLSGGVTGGAVAGGRRQRSQPGSAQGSGKRPPQKQFLQIVPRGVMFDGQTGLIKHKTGRLPLMFYREIKHLLSHDMVWPCPWRETLVGRVVGPIRFHTYDQTDAVLFFDSPENVSPRYRQHLVPSGNVLRFFGATEHGYSICVNVFGQRSYFYCEYSDTDRLREVIASVGELVPEPRTPYAVSVTPATKTSIYGYGTRPVPDLQCVSISNWTMARKIGEYLLEQGFPVYEVRVDPLTRLVIDRRITTFGWCSVNRYDWRQQGRASTCDIEVDCDVSDLVAVPDDSSWPRYRCLSFDIECMSGEGGFPCAEKSDDIVIQISCVCYETGGNTAVDQGIPNGNDGRGCTSEGVIFGHSGLHLFTIGTCGQVGPDVDVYEFPSEYELLLGFMLFFQRYAPAFVTGYNINSFDLKYILTRLEYLYKVDSQRFCKLPTAQGGRFFLHSPAVGFKRQYAAAFPSASHNNPASTAATKVYIAGSVVIDMYPVCMAKTNSPNYKLNTMAELYLRQRKDDLSYKDIPRCFVANAEGRAQVGRYCLQDAVLVRDLFNTINFHYEAGAIARLAKIPLRRVIFDGQQIRIYTSLLDECACRDFILPNHYSKGTTVPETNSVAVSPNAAIISTAAVPGDAGSVAAMFQMSPPLQSAPSSQDGVLPGSGSNSSSSVGVFSVGSGSSGGVGVSNDSHGAGGTAAVSYQGATVFEPEVGYYNDPVAVFDFASLYPSIIMAHNLCYSTLLVPGGEYPVDPADVYSVTLENGVTHRFVRASVRVSVLSELLNKWVSQRRAVRECMRECQDPVRRMLLDKEQMALKVTCNAFYGFTGVVNGMMPCLPIAASITRIGRDMLERTARFIKDNFSEPCFLHNFFNQEDYVVGTREGDSEESSTLPEGLETSSGGSDERRVEARVIYGDTDSVFVRFRGLTPQALVARGPSLAHYVTACLFVEPVKLEFEKVFVSLMMICKKRYIGKVEGASGLSMKGVDLVRKTACEFVKGVTRDVLSLLFEDREVSEAAVRLSRLSLDEVKKYGVPRGFWRILRRLVQARDDLYLHRVRVEDLVLSSVLSKDISLYRQSNLPHIAVIKRLAARSEELPSVGDRVFYVLTAPGVRTAPQGSSDNGDSVTTGVVSRSDAIDGTDDDADGGGVEESNRRGGEPAKKRARKPPSVVCNYEVAEDPSYVREHGVPIHADKYFEQVLKAVTNVLSPVFPGGETARKDKFLHMVLPRRLHLEPAFLPYSVKAHECC